GVLGGDVDGDGVHGFPGDLPGAVDDGLDRGGADQPEQAADHAAGPLVQVAGQAGEGAGLVAVQPQAALDGGGQCGPLAVAGEGTGADHRVAAGDLLTPGPDSRPARSTLIPASTKVAGI